MNRSDYIVILTLVAMTMLAISWAIRADGWARDYSSECPTWARMVERIETIPADQRDWDLWIASANKIV